MTQPSPGRSLYFMDISSNNPIPDLKAYRAAGHVWLARKVSEGVGYHWFDGDAVADAWHAMGGHVDHYHWHRPDADSDAQSAYFLGLVAPHWRPGDRTMNDWERSTIYSTGQPAPDGPEDQWAARNRRFNDACQSRFGAHTVYTGDWYLAGKPHMIAEVKRWPVILSDYSGGDGAPANPYGFKIWARQFTDKATVPGMSRPVDYNHILNPDLGGPPVSATGPEKWDAADWSALAKQLTDNAALRAAFHDAAFGDFNKDVKGKRQQLKTWLNRIRNGQFVALYDQDGKPVDLPPVK